MTVCTGLAFGEHHSPETLCVFSRRDKMVPNGIHVSFEPFSRETHIGLKLGPEKLLGVHPEIGLIRGTGIVFEGVGDG